MKEKLQQRYLGIGLDESPKVPTGKNSDKVRVEIIDDEEQIIQLPISSTYPVYRTDPFTGYEYYEVLEHTPEAVDLSRANDGAAVLFEHYGQQVGVFEKAWVENERVYAQIRFSKNNPAAVILYKDIKDKVFRNFSIDYSIESWLPSNGELINGIEVRTANKWVLLAVSGAPVQADPNAGTGRSLKEETNNSQTVGTPDEGEQEDIAASVGSTQANVEEVTVVQETQIQNRRPSKMANENTGIESAESEQKRVQNIIALAEQHDKVDGIQNEMRKALKEKTSSEEFGLRVIDIISKRGSDVRGYVPSMNAKKEEFASYDFLKVIRSLADGINPGGMEEEMHRELVRSSPAQGGGFRIPLEAFCFRKSGARANVTTPGSAGGFVVGEQLNPLIDLLRPKTVALGLGVQIQSGLVGNQAYPILASGSSAYWAGEQGPNTESQLTYGQITSSPKTLTTLTYFSRTLLAQSSPSVQDTAVNDVLKNFGVEMDKAIFRGTGGAQPLGILNNTGITSGIDTSSVNKLKMLAFEAATAQNNADFNNQWFVTTPAVRQLLKSTATSTNGPLFIWDTDNKVLGYNATISNLLPANTILFGDYSQVLCNVWNSISVEVTKGNKYETNNMLSVIGHLDMDVVVKNPKAFAKSVNAS